MHPDTISRAIRISAENLAKDSIHIPLIEQVLRQAFAQAEDEKTKTMTQAQLDGLYTLLTSDRSEPPEIVCKKCGKKERGYLPMVYVSPLLSPEDQEKRRAYNQRQEQAIKDGNVLCSDCAVDYFRY
jgi:fructosamine-3-kinase